MKHLDDRALQHVADYFRTLSEPLRLKILNALRSRPHNVNELTEALACSQANVSKHLGQLARHGLVARDARGTSAWYRIADPRVYELCDLVCGNIATQLKHHTELLQTLRAPPARVTPARATAARAASARPRRTAAGRSSR